jgi:ribonuclease R
MPKRYVDAIVKFLASRGYQPLKPRQLARQMGVSDADFGAFRDAVKRLRDDGRIVLGEKNALTLPQMSGQILGVYRGNPRGFGFVIPETPNAHGDLFIPRGADGGAMTGDRVLARSKKRGKRDGKAVFEGLVVEIVQRGSNRFVGTVERTGKTWFVLPDGGRVVPPIVLPDAPSGDEAVGAGPREGSKVVVEIIKYASGKDLPTGVIVETLGAEGHIEAETRAVIRAHGLEEVFSDEALAAARSAVDTFDGDDPAQCAGREDLSSQTIVTIDPPDARDFDDAISIEARRDGSAVLGVHIADVSHFVTEGGALDVEAHRRGTSAYFPRRVLPMLPEVLSNGVCSLQEGQRRFCKSVFITYDASAQVVSARAAETVIRSAKRLTYREAQSICDGQTGGFESEVVALVGRMKKLAQAIESRRRLAGMLHLDLPSVELVLNEEGKVVDAVPEDDSYTHTIIEMFMVEANEAAARLLDRTDRPFLRRVHPEPDPAGEKQLTSFVRACGHKIPRDMSRADLQALLEGVRGKPQSYAVNLAVLKTFQQAEYSPMRIGHYALASTNYCHFTSPIRRYPDLTIHRMIRDHCRGTLKNKPLEDAGEMAELGKHCTDAEKRAEAAERELREVLVLQFLEGQVGEEVSGVVTGVTNFGVFVQMQRFLVEGLVRMEDLGDDWWVVDPRMGVVRGERTGKTFRIGDPLEVRILGVDVARRQVNLMPVGTDAGLRAGGKKRKKGVKKAKGRPKSAQKPRAKGGQKPRQKTRAKSKPKPKPKG